MNTTSTTEQRVLVGVDGSPASAQALRTGRRLADLFGDRLVAVTVWEPFRHGVMPTDTAHPQQAAEQLVARCLLAALPGQNTDSVQILALEGSAWTNASRSRYEAAQSPASGACRNICYGDGFSSPAHRAQRCEHHVRDTAGGRAECVVVASDPCRAGTAALHAWAAHRQHHRWQGAAVSCRR